MGWGLSGLLFWQKKGQKRVGLDWLYPGLFKFGPGWIRNRETWPNSQNFKGKGLTRGLV